MLCLLAFFSLIFTILVRWNSENHGYYFTGILELPLLISLEMYYIVPYYTWKTKINSSAFIYRSVSYRNFLTLQNKCKVNTQMCHIREICEYKERKKGLLGKILCSTLEFKLRMTLRDVIIQYFEIF